MSLYQQKFQSNHWIREDPEISNLDNSNDHTWRNTELDLLKLLKGRKQRIRTRKHREEKKIGKESLNRNQGKKKGN